MPLAEIGGCAQTCENPAIRYRDPSGRRGYSAVSQAVGLGYGSSARWALRKRLLLPPAHVWGQILAPLCGV